jgi:hypothetical protein
LACAHGDGTRVGFAAGQARTDLGGQRFGDAIAQVAGQRGLAQLGRGGHGLVGNAGFALGNIGGEGGAGQHGSGQQRGDGHRQHCAHYDESPGGKNEAASVATRGFVQGCL